MIETVERERGRWFLVIVRVVEDLLGRAEVFGVVEEGDGGVGHDEVVVGENVGKKT